MLVRVTLSSGCTNAGWSVSLFRVYERWLECLHDLARACDMTDAEAETGIGRAERLVLDTCIHRRDGTYACVWACVCACVCG